jgi:hypothetical protein
LITNSVVFPFSLAQSARENGFLLTGTFVFYKALFPTGIDIVKTGSILSQQKKDTCTVSILLTSFKIVRYDFTLGRKINHKNKNPPLSITLKA